MQLEFAEKKSHIGDFYRDYEYDCFVATTGIDDQTGEYDYDQISEYEKPDVYKKLRDLYTSGRTNYLK